jgi:hypothetical protein
MPVTADAFLVEQLGVLRTAALGSIAAFYRGLDPDAAAPPHLMLALGKIVAIIDQALDPEAPHWVAPHSQTYRCQFCGATQQGPEPAFCHRPGCVIPHRAPGLMRLAGGVERRDGREELIGKAEEGLLRIIELAAKAYGRAAVAGDLALITALGRIAGIAAVALDPETRTCRVCGCTDERACPGGCSWVEEDLCSACATPGDGEPCLPPYRCTFPGCEATSGLFRTSGYDEPFAGRCFDHITPEEARLLHRRRNRGELLPWRNVGDCPECGGGELEDGPRGGAAINRRCVTCGAWWNTVPELRLIQRIREDEPRQYGRTITAADCQRLGWIDEIAAKGPDEWDAWVLAPSGLTWDDAEAWARMAGYGDHRRIHVSSGETLVRVK